jgi:hypothetical protein
MQFTLMPLAVIFFYSLAFAQAATAPSALSDQKAGGVLFFHRYVSNAANPALAETRINITNTSATALVGVHLFFVNRLDCSVIDETISLTPNQTTTLLASAENPGADGYLMAVAVNPANGRPIQAQLVGDAYLRETIGSRVYQANLAALSVAKRTAAAVPLDADGTARLIFDGGGTSRSYDRLPQVVAVSNFNTQLTDATNLVLYSPANDLVEPLSATASIFALVYNDLENVRSTTFSFTCYTLKPLGTLRVLNTLNKFVGMAQTGSIRMYAPAAQPLLGATLNVGSLFADGRNLHHLTLLSTYTIRIPVL